MTATRTSRRAAAIVFLAVGAFVGPSAALVSPYMNVSVTYELGRHKVCAVGRLRGTAADIGGIWAMSINGARSTGTDITFGAGAFGSAFPLTCHYVTKNGAPQGAYTVRLVYLGASSNIDLDVQGGGPIPTFAGGIATWTPGDNQFIKDS